MEKEWITRLKGTLKAGLIYTIVFAIIVAILYIFTDFYDKALYMYMVILSVYIMADMFRGLFPKRHGKVSDDAIQEAMLGRINRDEITFMHILLDLYLVVPVFISFYILNIH